MDIRDLLTEKRLRNLEEMVAEIPVEELKSKMDRGEMFKLVEVSNKQHYEQRHIQDAVNIPLASLKEVALQKFQTFQQIVVYCQESNSSVGKVAARILQESGFPNVLLLKGGKEAWQNAGLPLKSSKVETSQKETS
ncbi:MAG: rhodanese-like domain-containing protein [bacterium]